MRRFGKHKPMLFLLAVVVVQFIALTALLMVENRPDSSEPAASVQTQDDQDMPQWLQAAAPETAQPEEEEPEEEKKAPPADTLSAPEILSAAGLIAHGMGEMDGVTTLNCLESFHHYYEQGVRVFEVDLRLTSDMEVVLRHDWRAGWQEGISERAIPSLPEFLDKPLLEKYTPLSFRDLLLLMEEYPDICVITDSKFTEAEIVSAQFAAMVAEAEELELTWVLDRLVVQIYNQLMFTVVDNIYPFPHYIYTLYTEGFNRTEESLREKAAFCRENGIGGITMWDSWWKDEFSPILGEYGLAAYVHTVNDEAAARALLESGVCAVYTDSLTPADLAEELTVEGENTNGTD